MTSNNEISANYNVFNVSSVFYVWGEIRVLNVFYKGYERIRNNYGFNGAAMSDDDDEIAYFTVRWKTRASFVYRTKNVR